MTPAMPPHGSHDHHENRSQDELIAFWHIGLAGPGQNTSCHKRYAIIEEQYQMILQSPIYRERGLSVHFVLPEKCLPPGSCEIPAALLQPPL